jgi:L-threonylcarbamoyladenylate synthase
MEPAVDKGGGGRTRQAVAEAVVVLRRGGVVCFPTESFYGLAALAFDADAVARLIAAKGGVDPSAPMVCIAADLEAAQALWRQPVPERALALAKAHWPGALTIVAPAAARVPAALVGPLGVGVRIPPHASALALAAAAEQPITAVSANVVGQAPPRSLAEARAQLGARVDLYLDGGVTEGGAPSTIVEVPQAGPPRVVREGSVKLTSEELAWQR